MDDKNQLTVAEKRVLAVALQRILNEIDSSHVAEAVDSIVQKLDLRSALKSLEENKNAWLRAFGLDP